MSCSSQSGEKSHPSYEAHLLDIKKISKVPDSGLVGVSRSKCSCCLPLLFTATSGYRTGMSNDDVLTASGTDKRLNVADC